MREGWKSQIPAKGFRAFQKKETPREMGEFLQIDWLFADFLDLSVHQIEGDEDGRGDDEGHKREG